MATTVNIASQKLWTKYLFDEDSVFWIYGSGGQQVVISATGGSSNIYVLYAVQNVQMEAVDGVSIGGTSDSGVQLNGHGTGNILLNPTPDGGYVILNSVKSTTGDPAGPSEGTIYINQFDNKVRIYADSAWRDLVTW